jgi:serine/threonine-protein kinase RsbW
VIHCEHTWPATPDHVGDARACAAALAGRAGAPPAAIAGVRLAVSEAVTNVVLHGYRDGACGPVTLRAEAEDQCFSVVISDEGCGLSPRSDSPGAGLGLPLIAEVSDSMTVSAGQDGRGTVLRMTFDLPVAVAR